MVKATRNLVVLGIGLSISAIVGWLLLKENKRGKEVASIITVKSQISSPEVEEIPLALQPEEADDFTQIKDIGPRFAQALQTVGITRFEQLAKQTPETLAARLAGHVTVRAQRIRSNDWIGQAARLAKG
jgi:predicted flap endonuclease-1-like 5' DNA nuclease